MQSSTIGSDFSCNIPHFSDGDSVKVYKVLSCTSISKRLMIKWLDAAAEECRDNGSNDDDDDEVDDGDED